MLRDIYTHYSNTRTVTFLISLWQFIDQFRDIIIQPRTIDLSTRLRIITTEFVGFIPHSLVLRSIVLD